MTAVPMSEAIIRDMYQKPSDVTTAIIEQFDKSDYIGHKARIEPPIDDTCVWFLGVPEYVQWLESQSSSLLWITGDPGCGKTTLATFLIESIDQHLSLYGTDYLTTYFFFDWSTEDQVDGTALLFALIHQLLQADPALVLIANKYLEKSRRELDLDKLFEIFAAIVSAPERKPKRLVVSWMHWRIVRLRL
ncbi:hypothetical protein V3481_006982 [Fusarium oxysporum f. sp. vasinfectum]